MTTNATAAVHGRHRRQEATAAGGRILAVLIGIALVFEILGWIFVGESFLANKQRLSIIILQVSVIGIIAVGVTQVIITGGVDLSSGSIVGLMAMVAASFAQTSTNRARRLSGADRHPAHLADPGRPRRRACWPA